MKTFFVILFVLAAGWFLLIFGLRGMAAILRKNCQNALISALAGEEILKMTDNASYLGADFPGPNLPPRTSGALAVTDTRVLFLPWFPRRAITLPSNTIAGVSLQEHFQGMAYNIPALVMKVKDLGDPHGNIGWLIHEPEEWKHKITSILTNPNR